LKSATVTVPDIYEAVDTILWDRGGNPRNPIVVRGPSGGHGEILGSLAAKGAQVMREHPEVFRPLRLAVDFPAETERTT